MNVGEVEHTLYSQYYSVPRAAGRKPKLPVLHIKGFRLMEVFPKAQHNYGMSFSKDNPGSILFMIRFGSIAQSICAFEETIT